MKFNFRDLAQNDIKDFVKEVPSIMRLKVRDFMSPNIYVLNNRSTLKDAIGIFIEKKIDGVPIVDDDNNIVGVLTKTHTLKEINRSGDINKCVVDAMKKNIVVTSPGEDMLPLIATNIGFMPVIENGNIIGVLTPSEAIRVCFSIAIMHQEELKTIIDSAHNGIITVDVGCNIILINSAAENILSLSSTEVEDQSVNNIFPDSRLEDVINTGITEFGQKIHFKNKTLIANKSPLRHKGFIRGAVIVFQDISDFENIFTELKYTKALKEELDATIKSSFDGIYLTDNFGKILRMNDALTRITGINKEDLLGRTMTELVSDGIFKQSIPLDDMLNGKPITISQEVNTGKNILVTSTPVFDNNNKIYRIVNNVRDITELNKLKEQLEKSENLSKHYREQLDKLKISNRYIAKSQTSKTLIELVIKLSKVDTTVLILGESGVGKDMIADMLHENSNRNDKPMITINCAAIPENLLESELFGYEPGAFTGAHKKGKIGAFGLANGGTIFLDEIGELPLNLQSKLLRTIQKREITKLGSNVPIKIDVRIIAATNIDIEEAVRQKKFRNDLYYRLNVFPLVIPPLRERKDDIIDMVVHFTYINNKKHGFNKRFDEKAIYMLMNYHWPGNVRELENIIERNMITSSDNVISNIGYMDHKSKDNGNILPQSSSGLKHKIAIETFEKEIIQNAMLQYGTTRKAAIALGVSQPTIVRKIFKYGIKGKGHRVEN